MQGFLDVRQGWQGTTRRIIGWSMMHNSCHLLTDAYKCTITTSAVQSPPGCDHPNASTTWTRKAPVVSALSHARCGRIKLTPAPSLAVSQSKWLSVIASLQHCSSRGGGHTPAESNSGSCRKILQQRTGSQPTTPMIAPEHWRGGVGSRAVQCTQL